MQAGLVVVDEDRGGDVHGVDEDEPLADAALAEAGLDLGGDVDEAAPGGDVEPELLAEAFHGGLIISPPSLVNGTRDQRFGRGRGNLRPAILT